MRSARLICLAVASFVGLSGLPTSASAATGLSGAGSALAAPLVAEWAAAFPVFHGTSVSYVPVGSGVGISDLTSRAVDFAASDAPMTGAQSTACNGCYQIPWALSAIAVGFHINGFGPRLFLDGELLAQIYLGNISRWNDARIKALNPRAALPNLKITPIYSGGVGATYPFTLFLSKASASWRQTIGYGLQVSFPTGVAASSMSDVTTMLSSTNGSIAYVGASYLIGHSIPAAAIENAAHRFEYPNLTEIESAGRTVKHVPASNTLQIVDPPRSATIAYPIATYLYAIVPANARQKSELGSWLSYALGAGQAFGPAIDFAPLPANVLLASKATLSRFSSSP